MAPEASLTVMAQGIHVPHTCGHVQFSTKTLLHGCVCRVSIGASATRL